jgi:hypothetical protein
MGGVYNSTTNDGAVGVQPTLMEDQVELAEPAKVREASGAVVPAGSIRIAGVSMVQ